MDPGAAEQSLQHAVVLLLQRINSLLIAPPVAVSADDARAVPKPPTSNSGCQTDPTQDTDLVKNKTVQLLELEAENKAKELERLVAAAQEEAEAEAEENEGRHGGLQVGNPALARCVEARVTAFYVVVILVVFAVMFYGMHNNTITEVRLKTLVESAALHKTLAAEIRQNKNEVQQSGRTLVLTLEDTQGVLSATDSGLTESDAMQLWNHLVAYKLQPPEYEGGQKDDKDDDDDDDDDETIIQWMGDNLTIQAVVYGVSCGVVLLSLWSEAVWTADLKVRRPETKRYAQSWILVMMCYSMGVWFMEVDEGYLPGVVCYVLTACLSYMPVWRLVQLVRYRMPIQHDLRLLKHILPPPLMTNENLTQKYRHEMRREMGDGMIRSESSSSESTTDDADSDAASSGDAEIRTRVSARKTPGESAWCMWERPIPAIPTSETLSACWEPSKRREFSAPYYGVSHQVVMVLEYLLASLTHREFALLFYECLTVCATSTCLYLSRPDIEVLLLPLLASLLGLVVCVGRACERSLGGRYLPRPVWLWSALAFAAVCFVIGATTTADDDTGTEEKDHEGMVRSVYFGAFMCVWGWTYGYAELALMKDNVDMLSFDRIISTVSTWCRTPRGMTAILLHQGLYVALYLYAMGHGLIILLPFVVVLLIIGVLLAPMSLLWCVCLYLPLAALLLPSSMLLNDVPVGVLLATLSSVMDGPFLEQAKILLDTHYTVTLAGLLCLVVAMNYMFTRFWMFYMKTLNRNGRIAIGCIHAVAMYMLMVYLHVIAQEEKHSLLYLVYSLSACAALVLSCQAFYPYLLNVSGLRAVAKEVMPVENFGGMALGGDVETDHAQMGKAGLGAIVKRRKKAKRAEDLKDQGIIISNYMALGGWEWALYVVALRSVYLVNENTIIQQVASLCVVAPILSITYRYFRTWLCMSMDVVALVCATQARARVLMVYCLVLLVFHIITVMIIQVKRAALFPVVITLAMAAAGALIHALQTNESDEELGDLYEEALILDTLEYINSIFDKFAHS